MTKTIVHTAMAPLPVGPYSQAVEFNGMLFCSGQIPINPKTGEIFKGSIEEQTQLVMRNIEAVLSANRMKFEDVVKTTIFLADMNDFAKVNAVYGEFFKSNPPARSTVQVARLPKDAQVEIEVVAGRG